MNQPLLSRAETELEPVLDTHSGIGATLKGLREAKQLSLNEVSARLKFSTRQIEALETEQWERLPTGVSLRGFVKNYGRYLDVDVDALVTMLDNQVGSTSVRPIAVNNPASLAPADIPIQAEASHRPWGWLIIILVLLIVAAFYAIERGWVPDSWLIFDWLRSLKK